MNAVGADDEGVNVVDVKVDMDRVAHYLEMYAFFVGLYVVGNGCER